MIKFSILLTLFINQLFCLRLVLHFPLEVEAASFQPYHPLPFYSTRKSFSSTVLSAGGSSSNNDDDEKKNRRGYQFGDITKSLINKVTNKDEYKFGDLSRHLDSSIKQRIADLNEKNKYEFGDLTRYLVKDFTNSTNYEFGDITKEIIRRVKTKNYTMEDLALLIKALTSFGVGLTPVASFLPVKLLIELLNYSIAGDLGTKVVSSISLEIDKRMKDAIVGDENYQIGDLTKKAVLKYTGQEDYAFGDITKTVVKSMDEYDKQQKEIAALNQQLKEAREGKDVQSAKDDVKRPTTFLADDSDYKDIANELQAWDEKYLKALEENDVFEK